MRQAVDRLRLYSCSGKIDSFRSSTRANKDFGFPLLRNRIWKSNPWH